MVFKNFIAQIQKRICKNPRKNCTICAVPTLKKRLVNKPLKIKVKFIDLFFSSFCINITDRVLYKQTLIIQLFFQKGLNQANAQYLSVIASIELILLILFNILIFYCPPKLRLL